MPKSHVLVADDEELYRRALERILTRAGHEVTTARDANEALEVVSTQSVDLILADVRMPGINGLELVRQVKEIAPDLPCIVITGYGGPESSVDALRAGAFWYLEKPFDQGHLDVVRRLVEQAIEVGRLKSENRMLQHQLRTRYRFENIIGNSTALREVLDVVSRVADSNASVLVTGESGTGKELVARAIHYNSRRSDRMFVTVNCGAIPGELLESELFGHVRGAFTSAVTNRDGRFTLADGGTIFLDEIGDMSPDLQVKLLRVLQDGTFEPVGSSKTVAVDVRVVAATNQDLDAAIAEKRFRADLFYRLNVIPIRVPPLRDRREDIPALVEHFLSVAESDKSESPPEMSAQALELICDYAWPGNVRELENLIQRVVILSDGGSIEPTDLPADFHKSEAVSLLVPRVTPEGLPMRQVIDQLETQMILQALSLTQGNNSQAARLLGINRTTLLEKIRKKGIETPPSN